jgi:hypothetical protein
VQAYQTSQYVVPHSGIFFGKWRSSFAGNSDGKMNVQSACGLDIPYFKALPEYSLGESTRNLSQWLIRHIFQSGTCE